MLQIQNVSKNYQTGDLKQAALNNVSLNLRDSEFVAILGPSGSGKTTLIKLLLKLYIPDKGDIFIDGINLKDIDTEDYQKNMGAVFQDFVKYPLTVYENIGCGNIEEIHNHTRIYEAAKKSGADQFIPNLPDKYNTQLHREWSGGVQLSLGQWQKIAIGRIFMQNFPIVVLDEPTASLDPKAEYEIYRQFR